MVDMHINKVYPVSNGVLYMNGKIIADNLKRIRKQRGHTQVSLAEGLGLTFQQIQKYESGKNRIASETLFEISKILRIKDIRELYRGCE